MSRMYGLRNVRAKPPGPGSGGGGRHVHGGTLLSLPPIHDHVQDDVDDQQGDRDVEHLVALRPRPRRASPPSRRRAAPPAVAPIAIMGNRRSPASRL